MATLDFCSSPFVGEGIYVKGQVGVSRLGESVVQVYVNPAALSDKENVLSMPSAIALSINTLLSLLTSFT